MWGVWLRILDVRGYTRMYTFRRDTEDICIYIYICACFVSLSLSLSLSRDIKGLVSRDHFCDLGARVQGLVIKVLGTEA